MGSRYSTIKDPMVREYMERKDREAAEAAQARETQNMMSGIAGIGEGLSGLTQAPQQAMFNRWENMGSAPQMSQAPTKLNLDPIRRVGDKAVSDAQNRAEEAENRFQGEQAVTDLGQRRDVANLARQAETSKADPMSAESQSARNYLKMIAPNATNMANFDSLSAAQIEKIAPGLMQAYNAQENRNAQAAARQDAREDRRLAREERQQDRQDALTAREEVRDEKRRYDEGQRAAAAQQKAQLAMSEIEDRRTNIKQNIKLLKDQIENQGTFEMLGSENAVLERRIDEIATDMAKLMDPSSVARPSEVENVKRTLIKPTLFTRNATAQDILSKFDKDIDNRANNAYAIRGLTPPSAPNTQDATAGNKPFSIDAIRAERARRKGQ